MSYLEFLIIFLLPIIVFEFYLFEKNFNQMRSKVYWGLAFLTFMAVSYTTPWDNYLVKTKVWEYGADRVIGVIGYVPIEEYCFFVLQTLMTGLWCFFVTRLSKMREDSQEGLGIRILGALFFLGLTLSGLYWMQADSTRYLGLIIAWACPIMLLQWLVGGNYLWANRAQYLQTILLPTLYLWIADALAIKWGIWSISSQYTTGIKIVNLPIEEAVFFLCTNILVAQGLLLFWWFYEKSFRFRNFLVRET